jgi:hypothetical protein
VEHAKGGEAVTAREAKAACKTPGLTVAVSSGLGQMFFMPTVCVSARGNGPWLAYIQAPTWPLAVAAFKGWREAWLKEKEASKS